VQCTWWYPQLIRINRFFKYRKENTFGFYLYHARATNTRTHVALYIYIYLCACLQIMCTLFEVWSRYILLIAECMKYINPSTNYGECMVCIYVCVCVGVYVYVRAYMCVYMTRAMYILRLSSQTTG